MKRSTVTFAGAPATSNIIKLCAASFLPIRNVTSSDGSSTARALATCLASFERDLAEKAVDDEI